METLKYVAIAVITVFLFVILGFAVKTKKPFKILLFNAFIGIVSLAIIDLTSKFTRVYIPVNEYTVAGCGIFGMPGVLFFLILRFVFV